MIRKVKIESLLSASSFLVRFSIENAIDCICSVFQTEEMTLVDKKHLVSSEEMYTRVEWYRIKTNQTEKGKLKMFSFLFERKRINKLKKLKCFCSIWRVKYLNLSFTFIYSFHYAKFGHKWLMIKCCFLKKKKMSLYNKILLNDKIIS